MQAVIDYLKGWKLTPHKEEGWPALAMDEAGNLVTLENLPELVELPSLPPIIPAFAIKHTGIAEYNPPSTNVQILHLVNNSSLRYIGGLSSDLATLIIKGSPFLTKIESFPEGLKHLNISLCDSLAKLPPLPSSLRTLSIHSCKLLTHIPPQKDKHYLPSIGFLSVSDCPSLVVPCRPKKKNALFEALDAGMEFYDATRYAIANPGDPLDDPYEAAYRNQWNAYYTSHPSVA
jgi:hypothetical protein